MSDYPKFPKIPRLFRPLIVTEKIDGTNGLVFIEDVTDHEDVDAQVQPSVVSIDDRLYSVAAGSRTRWITPADDNFGFAKWVADNAQKLAELGEGKHYGEWWGQGIQRGYGLAEKRFSLFNVGRWHDSKAEWAAMEGSNPIPEVDGLTTVPPLMGGIGDWIVGAALQALAQQGSVAALGFPNPEGVVVFHTASNAYYKATLDNDGKPKTAVQTVEQPKSGLVVAQSIPESLKQAQKLARA